VLGGGAWGTALALAAAPRHATCLWVRDPAQALAMQSLRENSRYLPGVRLPDSLHITADYPAALAWADPDESSTTQITALTVIATPMAGLAGQLQSLHDGADARAVLWLCKGFDASTGELAHELAQRLRPGMAAGVLSGPSFAQEVALGQPTALVAASGVAALAAAAAQAFHSDSLRVYTSSDVVGVEVGGAVKNVMAIATGLVDGLPQAGLNARAALITRGLAEMTRLGLALGARADTFMGLSGLGDLVLTATGELSRNRRVGLLLASGVPLAQALTQLGHVAEGVPSAPLVLARAQALGVDMPITAAVVAVLQGSLSPAEAMQRLMARQAREEGF
jgi:glycerol-3-phosphate dehydrogenase (NAD(P)+)